MNKDKAYLIDISESMRVVVSHMGDATFESFIADVQKTDAVNRRLEIIGEATKRLTPALRDGHADIPWQKMAGMRDRLIHGYDKLDLDKVYDAVTQVIPPLIPKIETIIQTLPDPE
jgi:uncharacterized protein with HEPN domain